MNNIEKCRRIIANHQYETIQGEMIDVQTANCLVTIHDNLKEQNQDKFSNMSIRQQITVMSRMINKGALKFG